MRRINCLIALLLFFIQRGVFDEGVVNAQQARTGLPPIEQGTLREYAEKRGLLIGTLIQKPFWDNDALYKSILAKEFSLGVVILFMRLTQPERNKFSFRVMDTAIKFARANNMKLAGVALLYRDSTEPQWLRFNQPNCGGWSKEELSQIMKQHIQTLVSHGGDAFYVWDVVNEPLSKYGNMIPKCWYKLLGENYITNAFRYAREANPHVLLRLNETFGEEGVDQWKANKFFALVQKWKEQKVPIDVVGIQMHLEAQKLRPTYAEEFRFFLRKAKEVGVLVHVTEMDVYQGPVGLFQRAFEKQEEIFKTIMTVCLEFNICTSFSTWGLTDKYSWLRSRQTNRYLDAKPLLFNDEDQRKPTYFGVMEALAESKRGN